MSETIIQLSEKNSVSSSNSLTSNGDFEVTLKDKVVIRNNDRVDLKSVFVDSVSASQGKISVEEDITDGFVEVVPYIYNWTTAEKNYNDAGVADPGQLANQPDGKVYYASSKVNSKDAALRAYTTIAIASHREAAMKGNVAITIQYTRNDGTLEKFKIQIPTMSKYQQQLFIYKEIDRANTTTPASANTFSDSAFVNYKQLAGANADPSQSMVLLDPSVDTLQNDYNISVGFLKQGNPTQNRDAIEGFCSSLSPNVGNMRTSKTSTAQAGGIIHPRKKKQSFKVNKGEYLLSELCELIGDQITSNGVLTIDEPMDSALLTSDLQIKAEEGIASTNTEDFIYYVAEDASNVFRYANNITSNYFIGSDQFGLVADSATNKAKFIATHSNIYDTNGTVSIAYVKDGTRADADLYQANKNGGIAITDLSPSDLWDKLGFTGTDTAQQPSIIAKVVDGKSISSDNIDAMGIYAIDSTEGVITTGATKGIAGAIVKVDGGAAVFDKVQDVDGLHVATTTTTQIFAQTSQAVGVQVGGFFKIQVDLGINNDLVSSDNIQTNIQGVISKYFSQESYTSDMGSGSVSYVHRGADTFISRVRVRILDSDDKVDQNIQGDNTVFLSITRAEPE